MITLKHKDKTAVIIPEIGMNTVSLKFGEEELLRVPENFAALRARSEIYGTPLLLPPGRVPEGRFTFAGETYQLALNDSTGKMHIHGLLRDCPFAVTRLEENFAEGYFSNNACQIYPFPYTVREECLLDEEGYHQRVTIRNTGDKDMPLCFGLHSCFAKRDFIRLPVDARMEYGKKMPLDQRERLLAAGGKLTGEIDDSYSLCGHEILIGTHRYILSDNFIHMTVWNDDAKSGFIALEPQHGTANGLNSGCGRMVLAPGQQTAFETTIV